MGYKVLVLAGGRSREREVSLRSGKAVAEALGSKGHEVTLWDLNEVSVGNIEAERPEVVFLALHGKYGEDGTVQGLLDILDLPYTGPGVLASAMAMNKVLTKKLLAYEGLPTADFLLYDFHGISVSEADIENVVKEIITELGIPVVVKPATEGSSIGTSIVKTEEALVGALRAALEYDREIVVEKFIDGVEVTAAVLGNDDPTVLPLIEIVAENEFYDYEAKYNPGMSHHIIPARISDRARQRAAELAREVYKVFRCRGFSRVDFIIDADDNPLVLEINTIPGMTAMSLFPDAARAAGMEFAELCERIVKLALEK
ncbi:MAG: D-alanine--D-alanine ligase [Syntrophomonadaceae bacterium]|mgnify:CR=1 FL=1|nr:D-alanine--D-alanine ligase [Syntrophomonadaceae bacterium]